MPRRGTASTAVARSPWAVMIMIGTGPNWSCKRGMADRPSRPGSRTSRMTTCGGRAAAAAKACSADEATAAVWPRLSTSRLNPQQMLCSSSTISTCAILSGNSKQKHVKPPSRSQCSRPPCRSAICRATNSPRPKPSGLVLTKAWNNWSRTEAAGPGPVSCTRSSPPPSAPRRRPPTPAAARSAPVDGGVQGVEDEVGDQLADRLRVALSTSGSAGGVNCSSTPA